MVQACTGCFCQLKQKQILEYFSYWFLIKGYKGNWTFKGVCAVRDFTGDNSAWADFLISKAALILASIVLFAALFHLVSGFKDLEAQEQLDSLAWDFKTAVDEVGERNFQEEFPDKALDESPKTFNSRENIYCFYDKEVFRALSFEGDVKIRISGEYVCLEAESDERSFRAVRPFAFRVLPFNETVLQEKLLARFGVEGREASPLAVDFKEIAVFMEGLGTQEAVLDPQVNVSLKRELIYVKGREEVSAFDCILIYQ
ncbi:hypothetical protein [Methanosarcina sp.]|uniref:hypothetical protein n=1 Tax=Methanosarcina sp. TaxID=2213 RepID=UPI003BB553DA